MRHSVPPVCLFLALAMMVAGFCLWTVKPPAATVELHRAAAEGDDLYREAVETQLRHRQRGRKLLIGSLFAGGGLMVAIAFLAMPSAAPKNS
jgi:hypothetical protein